MIKGYSEAVSMLNDSVGLVYKVSMPKLSNSSEMMTLTSGAIREVREGEHALFVQLARRNGDDLEHFTYELIKEMQVNEKDGTIKVIYNDSSYLLIRIY